MDNKIVVYTDGSCIGNGESDSKGGRAVKMMCKDFSKTKSGHLLGKTNNYMEMFALLQAMKSITNKTIPTEIYSDSKYVVSTVRGEYKVGANEELWKQIFEEYEKFSDIKVVWIRGHNGNVDNEEVDKLAYAEAMKC